LTAYDCESYLVRKITTEEKTFDRSGLKVALKIVFASAYSIFSLSPKTKSDFAKL
jgi:hypothetical protein